MIEPLSPIFNGCPIMSGHRTGIILAVRDCSPAVVTRIRLTPVRAVVPSTGTYHNPKTLKTPRSIIQLYDQIWLFTN